MKTSPIRPLWGPRARALGRGRCGRGRWSWGRLLLGVCLLVAGLVAVNGVVQVVAFPSRPVRSAVELTPPNPVAPTPLAPAPRPGDAQPAGR